MPYRILLHRDVEKTLRGFPKKIQVQIRDRIDALAEDPCPFGSEEMKGDHAGLRRIQSGAYRIVYQVRHDVLIVVVVKVGPRKDVYR